MKVIIKYPDSELPKLQTIQQGDGGIFDPGMISWRSAPIDSLRRSATFAVTPLAEKQATSFLLI